MSSNAFNEVGMSTLDDSRSSVLPVSLGGTTNNEGEFILSFIETQSVIGVRLRTQCKGFAEEGSGSIDLLKILLNITFKAGTREIGESCCAIRMANRTLVQDQQKMLHSIVQVRSRFACCVFGKMCVARICVSSNLTVYGGLQLMFHKQKLARQSPSDVSTHIKQCTVLDITSMYNTGLEREGRMATTH
jgi:hypothetical protein